MSEQEQSKNARKKAMKAEAAAQKKAEKDAARKQQEPQGTDGGSKANNDDEDVDPTQYYANRVRALQEMESSGTNPYPHKFHVDITLPEYIRSYGSIADGERNEVCHAMVISF